MVQQRYMDALLYCPDLDGLVETRGAADQTNERVGAADQTNERVGAHDQ